MTLLSLPLLSLPPTALFYGRPGTVSACEADSAPLPKLPAAPATEDFPALEADADADSDTDLSDEAQFESESEAESPSLSEYGAEKENAYALH